MLHVDFTSFISASSSDDMEPKSSSNTEGSDGFFICLRSLIIAKTIIVIVVDMYSDDKNYLKGFFVYFLTFSRELRHVHLERTVFGSSTFS